MRKKETTEVKEEKKKVTTTKAASSTKKTSTTTKKESPKKKSTAATTVRKTKKKEFVFPATNPKYWLSVIIPAYNCSDTIERLLRSIYMQVGGVNDVEIVICDDNSTDNFMEKVEPFKQVLNIVYCKTEPRPIHCPGNTRMDGWHHATGEWITFIDHDDVFERDAFFNVKGIIKEQDEDHLVFTRFREWNLESDTCIKEYDAITWMHGKFYNRQWLIDNKIDFKENLVSHEDLCFNDRVFAHLFGAKSTYSHSELFTYKWIYKEDSTSRKNYVSTKEHIFVEENFDDYIDAAVQPWLEILPTYKGSEKFCFIQLCSALLYCYFYYQGFLHVHVGRGNVEVYNKIKELLYKILEICNCTKQDIIDHIYSIPDYYDKSKFDCQCGCYMFIEFKSFADFINET